MTEQDLPETDHTNEAPNRRMGRWGRWALVAAAVEFVALYFGDRAPSLLKAAGGVAVIYLVVYLVRGVVLGIRWLGARARGVSRRHD